MSIEEKRKRYLGLCHAMQTGVAYMMEKDPSDTKPKHLRVGINTSMVDHSALAVLLMNKGVITEDEYYDALIEAMEQEVQRYQEAIRMIYGTDKITLG